MRVDCVRMAESHNSGLLFVVIACRVIIVMGVIGLASSHGGGFTVIGVLHPQFGLDTNVIVGKLSHLRIINTDDFAFLISAKPETRDEMHDPADDRGHYEGITETGARVRELDAKLAPIVIEPATSDDSAVESGNRGLGEEGSHEVADDTTDTVRGEDIETVIVLEDEFELSSEVACGTGDDANSNCCGSADETRSGGNSNET